MEVYISNSKSIIPSIKEVLHSNFKFEIATIENGVENTLLHYFGALQDNLWFLIETDYVDKVYRDSYYFYFSSKRNTYHKDCIRISIFNTELKDNLAEFYTNKTLNEHYLGFIILRPTNPSVVGRSVINPKALKPELRDIRICYYNFDSTSNSVKFKALGFPHSSQESETITCAETALWSLMEYFGSKYPEYKPLLPSHIINILKTQTSERQIPSQGQAIYSLSYGLKELGFGPKVYSRDSFGEDFEKLLKIYIESGIPIILGIDNREQILSIEDIEERNKLEVIHHAILCIGRKNNNIKSIENLEPFASFGDIDDLMKTSLGVDIYDWSDVSEELVLMDDNRPAYQIAHIDKPTASYHDTSWELCKINHFVAPLYKKVYLEAQQARDYFLNLLNFIGNAATDGKDNLVIRILLASSRSYKEYIVLNEKIDFEVKELITQINMGKFVWVAELSTKEQISNNEVDGIILLDATEPNTHDHSPFLIAFINNLTIKYDRKKSKFRGNAVSLHPFKKFDNLKHIE